jgi:hypothetical protein
MAAASDLASILMTIDGANSGARTEGLGLQERSARLRAIIDSNAGTPLGSQRNNSRHSANHEFMSVDPITLWAAVAAIATSIGVSVQVFDRIKASAQHGLKADALRAITATMTPEQIDELYRAAAQIVATK